MGGFAIAYIAITTVTIISSFKFVLGFVGSCPEEFILQGAQ